MKTTLNMHKDTVEKIKEAALSRGISISLMISKLMQKVMGENIRYMRMGRLIQYQKRCGKKEWRKVHVKLRGDEYEYFHDLRKLLKMSVSFIVANAVKRYLNEIMNEKSSDNYPYHYRNYIVIREIIDKIVCWKHIWGYPLHIDQHIRQ